MESKLEAEIAGVDPNALTRSTGSTGPREYEFDASENEVISGLASAMRFVGVVFIVLGAINSLGGVVGGATLAAMITLGQGILMIIIGAWLIGGAGSFRDVVTTEGNDISHMMAALRKLRSVFTLQAWVLGIVIILALVVIVFALMSMGHHRSF
jgi:hypothetical protein